MSTNLQVAQAFAAHKTAKSGNAHTNGAEYKLHQSAIATHESAARVSFNWCGFYTVTTAKHLNDIAKALNSKTRFNYAQARDAGATIGYFEYGAPGSSYSSILRPGPSW